jgi:hypothetical protein
MFALFGKLWRPATVGQETRVASSALAAVRYAKSSTVFGEVGQNFVRVHVANNGSFRNLDQHFLATAAMQIFTHSVHAVACSSVGMIAKGQQRRHIVVGLKPYRTAVATVAAVWATESNWTLSTEADAACTTVASANVELGFVDKCTHRGFLGYCYTLLVSWRL